MQKIEFFPQYFICLRFISLLQAKQLMNAIVPMTLYQSHVSSKIANRILFIVYYFSCIDEAFHKPNRKFLQFMSYFFSRIIVNYSIPPNDCGY